MIKKIINEDNAKVQVFENKYDGVQSEMRRVGDKFHVRLKDNDSGNYLPETRIFINADKAEIYAESLVR